jgi:DNA-binding NarL/FixJ family response regulator
MINVQELAASGSTEREADVIQGVLKGWANKDIADQLKLSERTVKFHLTRIYKKFGVRSRTQLILKFMSGVQFQSVPNNA